MELLPIPQPGDLRELPLVEKSDARGLWRVVFAFLRMLRWFGNDWARKVYEDYKQEGDGALYWFGGMRTGGRHEGKLGAPPSASLRAHESVHDWQRRTLGVWRYRWAYANVFDRSLCVELEAMACGYEVAHFGRLAEERTQTLISGPYLLGKRFDAVYINARITAYAEAFR